MQAMRPINDAIRTALAACPCILLCALPCAGALTQSAPSALPALADGARSVVLGRYSTQLTEPPPELSEPMDVVVALTFPRQAVGTIDQALTWTLARTGYRFDDSTVSEQARAFLDLPLPESQRQIGPYSVRWVLNVLMGTAWQPVIDPANRTVRIGPRPAPSPLSPSPVLASSAPAFVPGKARPDAGRAGAVRTAKGNLQ